MDFAKFNYTQKKYKMKLVLFLFFVLTLVNLQAQPAKIEATNYQTTKIQLNSTIKIDGNLDDDAWKLVEWGSEFTQRQPFSGNLLHKKLLLKFCMTIIFCM